MQRVAAAQKRKLADLQTHCASLLQDAKRCALPKHGELCFDYSDFFIESTRVGRHRYLRQPCSALLSTKDVTLLIRCWQPAVLETEGRRMLS